MSRDIDLSGKVAAITGGSRGIGRGIAEALLKIGASVAINGRNEDKGQEAIKEIGENQPVVFIKGDVRKQSETENFIAKTIEKFGQIDILINNAGITGPTNPLWEYDVDLWNKTCAPDGSLPDQWRILDSCHYVTKGGLREQLRRYCSPSFASV